MIKNAQDISETLELNGEVYAINDHVYVSSPWNMADGVPWLIGRIMEFIRETLPPGSHKRRSPDRSFNSSWQIITGNEI
ncbi:hypothetical protein KEM48_009604 [Puccinia striiformis f. sp. tritici PST-130]|nr:hypothetical protein KEM48_009604 [Puccinia striiformis f. sp. tritici PST-130]